MYCLFEIFCVFLSEHFFEIMAVVKSLWSGYRPFLIQGASDTSAKDSLAEWGLIVKSFPFKVLSDPKEPYRNDWHDEDGDDEYNAQMFGKAYEITVEFLITADSPEDIVRSLMAFNNYIMSGEFKIFDTYTWIGRQKVRYAGYVEKDYKHRDDRICYTQFSLRFKVNDPVTFIYNNSGVLEEVTDE